MAQVAIEENNMIFFSFKAEDFGVALKNDQWSIFEDGESVPPCSSTTTNASWWHSGVPRRI